MENEKKIRKKILFVCTGNTCRSPMAEAAFRRELRRKKISGFAVASAGLRVEKDSVISANSVQALAEAKIPLKKTFKPRQLTEKMIEEAYVVICMTDSQERALLRFPNVTSFPSVCGKEIPDPYGREIDVYRATLRRIRECVPLLVRRFCEDGSKIGD